MPFCIVTVLSSVRWGEPQTCKMPRTKTNVDLQRCIFVQCQWGCAKIEREICWNFILSRDAVNLGAGIVQPMWQLVTNQWSSAWRTSSSNSLKCKIQIDCLHKTATLVEETTLLLNVNSSSNTDEGKKRNANPATIANSRCIALCLHSYWSLWFFSTIIHSWQTGT